jgi:PAS domain S-box-containing protein
MPASLAVPALPPRPWPARTTRHARPAAHAPGGLYEDLLEHALDPIQAVTPRGRFLYVNRAWRELLGYSAAEVARLTLADVVTPASLAHCRALMRRLRQGETLRNVAVTFVTRAGVHVETEGSVSVRMENGRIISTRGVFRDVTDRRRAEAALAESERRYRGLVESASDIIYRTDARGVFTYANPTAARLMGIPVERIVGLHYTELVREDARSFIRAFYEAQAREGTPASYNEFPAGGPAGREVWVGQNVQLLFDDGRVVGAQAVARDITAQRELERMKDEILSVAGHELRSPLTALLGSLDLLDATSAAGLSPAGASMLRIARQNTRRLLRLVNDMLDVERLEAGRMVLQPAVSSAAALADEAVGNVATLAEARSIRVHVDAGPRRVLADPDRVVQVLVNLLSNAVKFSDEGAAVELTVREGEGRWMRVEVADHGRGIPPEMQERIFERFQQVQAGDGGGTRGSGLGLAIARGIVRAHGGEMGVTSEPGRGSTFWFTLPAAPPAPVEAAPT